MSKTITVENLLIGIECYNNDVLVKIKIGNEIYESFTIDESGPEEEIYLKVKPARKRAAKS